MSDTPQSAKTVESLWRLQKIILNTLDFKQVVQKIVDSLAIELDYLNLGYRIVVLALADDQNQVLRRVSMSQTPAAEAVMSAGDWTFDEIIIPYTAIDNLCIQALKTKSVRTTNDWKDVLTPPMEESEARRLQTVCQIQNSVIYPLTERGQGIGVLIFSLAKPASEITPEEKELTQSFTEIVSLALHDAKLYAQVEEANEKLVQLDKAKDEFVSLASHELRTPMTAIKSYVWMVLNNKAGIIEPTTKQYLELVFNSTERLIHLVNDMLDISRIESGKTQLHPALMDMSAMMTQIMDEFKARAIDKQITLKLDIPTPLPEISADKDKVMQVWENLVGNALKFTPPAGTITLHTAVKDKEMISSVNDTGKGIAPEDISKLFTKFERLGQPLTTLSEPGTGLGLYLCKEYIELHKGRIWAESELGKGSTFTFTLPMS